MGVTGKPKQPEFNEYIHSKGDFHSLLWQLRPAATKRWEGSVGRKKTVKTVKGRWRRQEESAEKAWCGARAEQAGG